MTEPAEGGECAVLIVGAGPTGLLLACLLARRGVQVRVLERRTAPAESSRAIGLHPPALRALAELGLDREAIALGQRIRVGTARSGNRDLGTVDFARAGAHPPFVLSLPQSLTEGMLARRLAELAPSALSRGWEVTALHETASTVTVIARASGGRPGMVRLRAGLLIGADGCRSQVREMLGITTTGRDYPDTYQMGDFADLAGADGEREAVIHLTPDGVVESFPLPDGRRRWVVHTGAGGADPSPARLAALVRERTGTVLDPGTTTMFSAFTVRRRMARRLLTARCVLLGDAAHEISPIGGQGITLGWLDALDLAPLIARAAAGAQSSSLKEDPAWCRAERSILRRARLAAVTAGANTALGRPAGARASTVRALAVCSMLRTPLRSGLAWAYSMGWTRAGRR